MALEPGPEDLLSSTEAGNAAIRGGALRVASFLTGSMIAIVSGALLFRHLGVTETGRYTTALSLAALVAGLTDLGLTAVGVRELAVLEGEARARLARNLLGIRLVLTTVGVAVISAFAFAAYDATLACGVVIAGAGVLANNIQTTYSVPLQAELRLGWVSIFDLARSLGTAALVVLLVVAGSSLLPFLATQVAVGIAVAIPTAMLVRGNIPLAPLFCLPEWRSLVAPVLTYSLAVAAAALAFRVAIVLVSLISDDDELGYFSLSFRITEVLLLVPALLVGAAFPIFSRAARDDPARLGYAISRVFEVSLIAGTGIALMLAVGAPIAVEVMGGSGFEPAEKVLVFQAIGLGASFVGAVWGFGLLSLRQHAVILAFNVTLLLAIAASVAVLASADGARGAAIATAGVEVVAAIVGGLLLVRGRPHLRPRLTVVPKVALAATAGALPALVPGLPVLAQTAAAGLLFTIVVVATRAIPDEVAVLLPARLGRLLGAPGD